MNALDVPAGDHLRDALERADSDHNVRVIVLSGRGRAFCAGDDIGDFAFESAGETRFITGTALYVDGGWTAHSK